MGATWRELVCARCGGTIAAARCAACRAVRDDYLTRERRFGGTSRQWLVFALLLSALLVAWLLGVHH